MFSTSKGFIVDRKKDGEENSVNTLFNCGVTQHYNFDKFPKRFIKIHVLRAGVLKAIGEEMRRRKGQPFEKVIPIDEKRKIVFEGGRWRF